MQHSRRARPPFVLVLALLSACAAADAPTPTASSKPTGVFGEFLVGRFALDQSDPQTAASQLLQAHASRPDDTELLQQAFIAALSGGRPEAVELARQLPDSQPAQLLLGAVQARAGHWQAAEQHFRALPRQGLAQVLQPLLIAWAQQGAGHTDAALSTIRPYLDGQRFRGVYALHSALIADQAGRTADAGRLYRLAVSEYGTTNLRLAQIVASWQARQGQFGEAQKTLAGMAADASELSISLPALAAAVAKPPVATAVDGIAESYLALAAALSQQDAGQFALLLLHLSLDLRPDFTAARLLAADILDSQHLTEKAQQVLAQVRPDDTLIGVVRLHRATESERLGHVDDATRELRKVAQDYPDSPIPAIREGDLLRSKQRFSDAITAYDRAIARISQPTEQDWLVFYDRAICYERAHQWAKAEADFKHALTLAPDQPYVLNYLGYSWADMGQHLNQAREMIEKAAQHRPNDGAIVDSLGWVMLRQGDIDDAVRTLERAVELEPEDAAINGHLGDAYWASGRKLEATYQWRRALTFNPEPADAVKLEAKLQGSKPISVVSGQ
jgi:tetratricopeptide (TPR) repeat protein